MQMTLLHPVSRHGVSWWSRLPLLLLAVASCDVLAVRGDRLHRVSKYDTLCFTNPLAAGVSRSVKLSAVHRHPGGDRPTLRYSPGTQWSGSRGRRSVRMSASESLPSRVGGSLQGMVALVTGASRGIGRGIALELALAGATVYATGRSLGPEECTEGEGVGGTLRGLQDEAQRLGSSGGKVIGVACDHRRDEQVKAIIDTIQEQHGRLHLLVNNAFQIANAGGDGDASELLSSNIERRFWEQGLEAWDSVIGVGLRSHYVASVYAAPLLMRTAEREAQGYTPCIVNVGSFGGVSYIFNVAYGVGKAGVDRLSRDMAIELRPKNVAAFSLWPGVVLTERMAWLRSQDPIKWQTLMGVQDDSYLESPRLSGRVVASLMAQSRHDLLTKRSGTIQIVAEVARELSVCDPVSGLQPPSIRSLQFLLPNFVWPKAAPTALPFPQALKALLPDWKLPLTLMSQRPQ